MKKLLILALMMLVLGGCNESDGNSGPDPDNGKIAVAFSLPGIGADSSVGGGSVASVETRAGKPVPLDENVTVRIVAYERKGTLADLSSDDYVGEATYQAVKEGDEIVLKPCNITFDTTTGRISSVNRTAASPLRLMAGTYDFYAVTPALQLELDASGKKPKAPAHASVFHGDDFASSLTESVEVLSSGSIKQPDPDNIGSTMTQADGLVKLTVLDRKCSKISFSITRKSENVSKVVIDEVKLSKIAHSPAEAVLCQAIPLGTNDGSHEFPKTTFVKGTEDYQYSVADEVLPKSSASFDLDMKAFFNDSTDTTKMSATIPAMAFAPDFKYNFNLSLKGGFIVLLLQITPWNAPVTWESTDMGGYPSNFIEVGKWGVSWDWSIDIGGYPVLSPSIVGWESNIDWETELGAYLSIQSNGPSIDSWNDKSPWNTTFE